MANCFMTPTTKFEMQEPPASYNPQPPLPISEEASRCANDINNMVDCWLSGLQEAKKVEEVIQLAINASNAKLIKELAQWKECAGAMAKVLHCNCRFGNTCEKCEALFTYITLTSTTTEA